MNFQLKVSTPQETLAEGIINVPFSMKTCRTEQVHLSGSKFFLNKKINRRGKKRPTNLVLARIRNNWNSHTLLVGI